MTFYFTDAISNTDSSVVRGAWYSSRDNVMVVEFPNGSKRSYDKVQSYQWESFISSPSLGKHYNQYYHANPKHTSQPFTDDLERKPLWAMQEQPSTERKYDLYFSIGENAHHVTVAAKTDDEAEQMFYKISKPLAELGVKANLHAVSRSVVQ